MAILTEYLGIGKRKTKHPVSTHTDGNRKTRREKSRARCHKKTNTDLRRHKLRMVKDTRKVNR